MRQPDMLLTAEDGWLGEFTHGPDKKVELLRDQRIVGRPGAGAGGMEGGGVVKVHQLTMEQAFRDAGSQHYRRKREVRREGDVEREERKAAREWLRHVEAGRLG